MSNLRICTLLALASLTGCFSLGRDEPVEQHYLLGGSALPDSMVPSDRPSGLRIGLRRLQIAEYLESPLIVVRQGSHEIRYSEFHRWGGTLNNGVGRALASNLEILAPLDNVDLAPWAIRTAHDYLIQIHLEHLEGRAPEEPIVLEGGVHLMASWEILDPQNGDVLVRGTTEYEENGWTVGDYAGLVERLDAGLWELSLDLVEALDTIVGL